MTSFTTASQENDLKQLLQLWSSTSEPLPLVLEWLQNHFQADAVSVHHADLGLLASSGNEIQPERVLQDLDVTDLSRTDFISAASYSPNSLSFALGVAPDSILILVYKSDTVPLPAASEIDAVLALLSILLRQRIAEVEQALIAEQAETLLISMEAPIFILDAGWRVRTANAAAEKLFSKEVSQMRGHLLADVVQSDSLMQIVNSRARDVEWATAEPDERTFVPLVTPTPIHAEPPTGWIVVLRDVSKYKMLYNHQHQFVRVVTHDLRSPLTSIQGFADMMQMGMAGEVTEKQVYFIDKILMGIEQMTRIVDNIQDAGRYDPETGFYEISRGALDLGELVGHVVHDQLVPAEKQDISIDVRVDDVPIINGDVHMLERAITNLVDNALKYTPNGSSVVITVRQESNNVLIEVHDDGLGISEEDQKRLFKRHSRIVRKEHKRIKGTGLGLFIVKSVAQRHGGTASVQSVLGEGATFAISIPLEGDNVFAG